MPISCLQMRGVRFLLICWFSILSVAANAARPPVFTFCVNAWCGAVDANAQILQPFIPNRSIQSTLGFDGYILHNGKVWTLFNYAGNPVVARLLGIDALTSERYSAKDLKGRFFLLDRQGNRISDQFYETLNTGGQGEFIFYQQHRKFGALNALGEPITKPVYENLDFVGFQLAQQAGLVMAARDGRDWVINMQTGQQMPVAYQSLGLWGDDHLLVHKGNLVGLAEATGRVTIAPKYSWLGRPAAGLVAFRERIDGACGYLDYRGQVKIAPQYMDCAPFGHAVALAKEMGSNGKIGLIGRNGQWLQEPVYESDRGGSHQGASPIPFYPGYDLAWRSGHPELINLDRGEIEKLGEYTLVGVLEPGVYLYAETILPTGQMQLGIVSANGQVLLKPGYYQRITRNYDGAYWLTLDEEGRAALWTRTGQQLLPARWPIVQIRPDLGLILAYEKEAEISSLSMQVALQGLVAVYDLAGQRVLEIQTNACGAQELLGQDGQVIWPKDSKPFCSDAVEKLPKN